MTKKELNSIFYLRKEIKMWETELNSNIDNETQQKINDHLSEIKNHERVLIEYISGLSDSYMRQILFYRCVKCMSWSSIAQKIGGGNSADGIRKMYERFIP